ncbi:flavin reductase family protein [Achromobacter aegrifaciens]|uniref:flavin reductase family protein n=1 Tax=Achromobacter aegrifaciens TaxID=1287736 RepID=UPI0032084F52
MYFPMAELSGDQRSKIMHSTVLPRPIAWITSTDPEGNVNAAPFSFFNVISGNPPLLCVCIGKKDGRPKDTAHNIATTREFVVNLVSGALVHRMVATSIEFEPKVDESAEAQLCLDASRLVQPPRIEDSPASFECRVRELFDIDGVRSLVLADVLAVHVMDAAVLNAERMHFDPNPMDLIARMQNPGWYGRIGSAFQVGTPSVEQWDVMKRDGDASAYLERQAGD